MAENEMTERPVVRQDEDGEDNNGLSIQDLIYLCISRWKWFVASVVVVLGIAMLYLLRTVPVYERQAMIMIKDDSKSAGISSDVSSMFSDLGIGQGKSNVYNELSAIQAPPVLLETGKRLALDVSYQTKGLFHNNALYGATTPVKVMFHDLTDEQSASFKLELLKEGDAKLSDFKLAPEPEDELPDSTMTVKLNTRVATPVGEVTIATTDAYEAYIADDPKKIYVGRSNLYNMTDGITANLTAEIVDKNATLISLTYKDAITQRAEDVLNTIITVYREYWMSDKNQMTIATTNFITERLGVIERELGDVDQDISSFKSQNLLPDVETASELFMQQSQQTRNQILELTTQRSMVQYVRNYLTENSNQNQLLPSNTGIENQSVEKQIEDYNTLQLQRNNLVANSSERNPLVQSYDEQLASMRQAIMTTIDQLVVSLNTQIQQLQRDESNTNSQIASNPDQAKYLQSVGRQQQVKETLYLFLLQKREENELSQAFTAYNTRIISPPTGKLLPVSPKRGRILAIAFMLGLCIPVGVIYLRETLNTKIRGRKDLEKITIPFLGEIPLYIPHDQRHSKWEFWKKTPEVKHRIVVKEARRDVVNEAFRVVRTNLEFMVGSQVADGGTHAGAPVIIFTSFNAGSGKSFLTMNIAVSLALKKKKVLVIDGDLRHGSSSAFVGMPDKGLAEYLGGTENDAEHLLVTLEGRPTLQVMPIGTIPPNPTELLFSHRFSEFIQQMRSRYDYIFIDCPPIEIVADTQIIEKYADRTVFVVRAGLLERSMLPDLQALYDEHRYKNMSLILNGTANSGSRYGYSYRYGYGYGYGYGYNYDTNKS